MEAIDESLYIPKKQVFPHTPNSFKYLNGTSHKIVYDAPNSAIGINKHIKKALKKAGLNKHKIVTSTNHPRFLLGYGKCFKNVNHVNRLIKGGEVICGWAIFTGKHIVEFEAHSLWLKDGIYYEVTACEGDAEQRPEQLFVIDDNVKNHWVDHNRVLKNMIYLKNSV